MRLEGGIAYDRTPNADAMVRLEAPLINWCEGYRPKPRDNITCLKDNDQSRSAMRLGVDRRRGFLKKLTPGRVGDARGEGEGHDGGSEVSADEVERS
jgi:hypothetical protein